MNESHLTYLASPQWAETLRNDLLPWLRESDLGDDVLEIGPGPGLTTDLLLELAPGVTAVEVDPALAAALRERLAGTAAVVIEGDASALDLPAARFSAVTCFSMLHHVDPPEAQDRLLANLHGALRPGGGLFGVESVDGDMIRGGHVGDTYNPVDPDGFEARLRAAGFGEVTITRPNGYQFRFAARA